MQENAIINGDCLEVLPQIEDESVDLVFADPPFNVGKPYDDDRRHYEQWCDDWISECFRVLKPKGSFYLMTLPRYLDWQMPIMSREGHFIDLIIWKTTSLRSAKARYVRQHQPIMLYGKTDSHIFNKEAQTVLRHNVIVGKPKLVKGYQGRIGNIWDDIKFVYAGAFIHPEAILEPGTKRKAHPCQMPLGLATRAILHSTNEGDIVLAPFCGSGTTAVACVRTGRRYIAIDTDSGYCEMARRRLENRK